MERTLVIGLAGVFLFSAFAIAADAYLDIGPTPNNDPPEECPDLLNPQRDYGDPSAGNGTTTSGSNGSELSCGGEAHAGQQLPYRWLWPFYYKPKIGGGSGRMWW